MGLDDFLNGIQNLFGAGNPVVGGQQQTFTNGGMAALNGFVPSVQAQAQPSQLPIFGMPDQQGGTVGQNGFNTNTWLSNFSPNDLSRIGTAGAGLLSGNPQALGGLGQLSMFNGNPAAQSLANGGGAFMQPQPQQRPAMQPQIAPARVGTGQIFNPGIPGVLAGLLSGRR
jgi:hypothetical protein